MFSLTRIIPSTAHTIPRITIQCLKPKYQNLSSSHFSPKFPSLPTSPLLRALPFLSYSTTVVPEPAEIVPPHSIEKWTPVKIKTVRRKWEERGYFSMDSDFTPEHDILLKRIPIVDKNVVKEVEAMKQARQKIPPEKLEEAFYVHVTNGDSERAFVTYYDFKEVKHPSELMCCFMFIYAGKQKDILVMRSIYQDLRQVYRLTYTPPTISILLKGLCQFGEMSLMLEIYENLYTFAQLPEKIHWQAMLISSARAGDPKHFARFFYRLLKKNLRPPKDVVVNLMNEWGKFENIAWKSSAACNCHVHDFVYIVDIAQRVRNYKRAIQSVLDIYELDLQPTFQLYEMFLKGVQRDFPRFRLDVREWRLKFRFKYGTIDKPIILEFEAWMKKVKEYIGEDKLHDVPLAPFVPSPVPRITRKEVKKKLGILRPRTRFTSQFTDDSRLFEFVPHYLRRLEREKKESEKLEKTQSLEKKIDDEILTAEKERDDWIKFGFKGDSSLVDEGKDGEMLEEEKSYVPKFSQ